MVGLSLLDDFRLHVVVAFLVQHDEGPVPRKVVSASRGSTEVLVHSRGRGPVVADGETLALLLAPIR